MIKKVLKKLLSMRNHSEYKKKKKKKKVNGYYFDGKKSIVLTKITKKENMFLPYNEFEIEILIDNVVVVALKENGLMPDKPRIIGHSKITKDKYSSTARKEK